MSSIWTITNYSDIKISKQHLPEVSKDRNYHILCFAVMLGPFAWFLCPMSCIREPGCERSNLHFCCFELLKVAHTGEGACLNVEFSVYCVYLGGFRYLQKMLCRYRLTTRIMGDFFFFSSACNPVQFSEAFWLDKLWKSFVHRGGKKKDGSLGYLSWTLEGAAFTADSLCPVVSSVHPWAGVRVLHTTEPSPFSWGQPEFLSHWIFFWRSLF